MKNLNIKVYADGADLKGMLEEYNKGVASGFTTNPSLMKVAGVTDYKEFAKNVLVEIKDMPISFEVFSDDLDQMEKEATEIASWGENVYVKIPVTNTKGEFTGRIIKTLAEKGVKLNITAVFTMDQVKEILYNLDSNTESIISIFAGRIADTGVDPEPLVREAVELAKQNEKCEILWASCREALSIVQAEKCGCHIITVQNNILEKVSGFGKDLEEYSLETIKGFYKDAISLGYSIL